MYHPQGIFTAPNKIQQITYSLQSAVFVVLNFMVRSRDSK